MYKGHCYCYCDSLLLAVWWSEDRRDAAGSAPVPAPATGWYRRSCGIGEPGTSPVGYIYRLDGRDCNLDMPDLPVASRLPMVWIWRLTRTVPLIYLFWILALCQFAGVGEHEIPIYQITNCWFCRLTKMVLCDFTYFGFCPMPVCWCRVPIYQCTRTPMVGFVVWLGQYHDLPILDSALCQFYMV